jgi:hypothetical protein
MYTGFGFTLHNEMMVMNIIRAKYKQQDEEKDEGE